MASTKNYGALAQTAILVLFMVTPSLGLLKVWPLPSAITTGLTMLSVGLLFVTVSWSKPLFVLRFNVAIFLFLSLISALVVSVCINDYAYEASWRWYLISLIVCVMLLFCSCEMKANGAELFNAQISSLLWIGCLIYAVTSLLLYYGVLSLIVPWAEPAGGRLAGVWGQPNLTTTTGWLGLLAGAVACSRHKRIVWWYTSVFLFGWLLACAASRMSWIVVVSLLILVWTSRLARFRTEQSDVASRLLFFGVLIAVILFFLVPLVDEPLHNYLVHIGLLDPASTVAMASRDIFHDSARLTEFEKVFSVGDTFTWSQWLFGIGPGNYPVFSYSADMTSSPAELVQGAWLHSHNLFTMMFVELGFLGLFLAFATIITIAFKALKNPMTLPRFFSIGGIGILFIHSNLEFPLWNLWFLILLCFFLTNLFDVKCFKADAKWLKPTMGFVGFLMIVILLLNVGYQYFSIVNLASKSEPTQKDYQSISFLANDSLMGPYAVLRKYHDFAPESGNLDWQLREVRKMKSWQPRDLVVLREFSLMVLKNDIPGACNAAQKSAFRYPSSASIMLDHSLLAKTLSAGQIAEIANCIEKGLAPHGETILTIQNQNKIRALN